MADKWISQEEALASEETLVDIDKMKEESKETPEVPETPETPEAAAEPKAEETPEAPEAKVEPEVPEAPPAPEDKVEPEVVTVKIGEEDVPVDQVRELLDMQHNKIGDLEKKAEFFDRIEKDEALMNMIKHYENGGKLTDYLQSQVDYSTVSDLDLIKEDFDAKFAGLELDSGLKEQMFKKHLSDKYKFDPDGELELSEIDIKMGEAELKRDAKALRDQKVEKAQSFKIAEREVVEPTPDQGQEVDLSEIRKAVESNPVSQELINSKMIKVGEANFELKTDPNELVEMAVDGSKFYNEFRGENGEVDYGKWYDTVAFVKETEAYKEFLINQGRMMERDAQLKDAKKLDDKPKGHVEKQEPSEHEKLRQAVLGGKWSTEIRP